jgi:hypothetical protein
VCGGRKSEGEDAVFICRADGPLEAGHVYLADLFERQLMVYKISGKE